MSNRNAIIIVEGPQGVGKTTLTNWLREHIPYTILMRLTGIGDKTQSGRDKIWALHHNAFSMMDKSRGCGANFVLDRSFISQQVYSRMGGTEYPFDDVADRLWSELVNLTKDYDVHMINLYLGSKNGYLDRLSRDKASHKGIAFSIDNSWEQQHIYAELTDVLAERRTVISIHNVLSLDDIPVNTMSMLFSNLMGDKAGSIYKTGREDHELEVI